ncbi:hypothetical protein [Lysinibacter sp. HNR]|uniref:hypothetical protein n=1 Tax=Lysinibacter sp. HNR TaxID=3031408 RepID=UPI002434874B|nr:hypothetical protein [Lysinibacter sp. HNR]WGD36797.1 hypothetical protein FrondiHNR_10075 [Lysinibacter sp. HNR]
MRKHALSRLGLAPLLCGIILALGFNTAPSSAIATDNPILDVSPESITVAMPFPGHSSSWILNATNPSSNPTKIFLTVTQDPDPLSLACEQLDSIDRLILLTVTINNEQSVNTTLCDIHNQSVPLGSLPPQETIVLNSTVSLSSTAGNQFQGISQALTFTITATVDALPPPPFAPETPPFTRDAPHDEGLALTGSDDTSLILWILLSTAGVGTYLTTASFLQQRRNTKRDSS